MEHLLTWLGELSGISKILPTTFLTSLPPQTQIVLSPNGSPELVTFLVWIRCRKWTRLLQVQATGTESPQHRATPYWTPTVKSSSVSAARALNCSQSLKQTLRNLDKVATFAWNTNCMGVGNGLTALSAGPSDASHTILDSFLTISSSVGAALVAVFLSFWCNLVYQETPFVKVK